MSPQPVPDQLSSLLRETDPGLLAEARQLRAQFVRMQMEHQFAVDEVLTKLSILRQEFRHLHRYNPIEHITSRVKTPQSLLAKALRRNLDLTPAAIRAGITDIAGVRISCSFIRDTYRVLETLTSQSDITVHTIKDYIANPKPNGYRSLHAIIEVPVFLSSGPVPTLVEVQLRTIAMDFWASLDHKIHYKYQGQIPPHLMEDLTDAARVAAELDARMESIHREVVDLRENGTAAAAGERLDSPVTIEGFDEQLLAELWRRTRKK